MALSLCGVLKVTLYFSKSFQKVTAGVLAIAEALWLLGVTVVYVRIAKGGLNFYLSFSFFILFSLSFLIYFLFLELGLGLEGQDHAVTQQVTSDDTVTSHMTHRRA